MKRITGTFGFMFLLFVLSATFAYGDTVTDMKGNSFPSGTTVTASTVADSFIPNNVIDKDLNTRWNATTFQGSLQLDFPSELNISAVQLAAVATPATDEEYTIFGLKEGSWAQISELTIRSVPASAESIPLVLEPIPVVSGNYDAIKIEVNGRNSWVAINEITYINENETLNAPYLEKMVDGTIALSWNSVEGATGYEVKRSERSGGPYTIIATTVSERTWYIDEDSFSRDYDSDNNYKSFYYVVTAINGTTTSANSNEVSLIRPSTPINVHAEAGDSLAKVKWDLSEGATSYGIYVSTAEEGPYKYYGYVTDNQATVTKLVNGTTYFIKVNAENAESYSTSRFSSPVSVIPGIQEAPTPTITSISPNNGPMVGGTIAYINGTKFVEGAQVYFNDNSATTTFVSTTRLRIIVPSASLSGFVNVKVINPNLQSVELQNGYKYNEPTTNPAPTTTKLTPANGLLAGGGIMNVYGTGYKSGAQVSFDGTMRATTYVSATNLRIIIPAGTKLGVVEVFVINPDGQQSSSIGYEYIAPAPVPAPTTTKLTPANGLLAGGGIMNVYGTGYKSGAQVSFDGKMIAATYVSATNLRIIIPAGTNLGVVEVFVINPDGQQSSSVSYEYIAPAPVPAPTTTTITPANGLLAGGGIMNVFGTGYKSGAQVSFDGKMIAATYVSATNLRIIIPAGTNLGVVQVFVINPDGQQSSSVSYEYK